MTKAEIIDHLVGMREYSEDMAKESLDNDDIWLKDVEVITAAIEIIMNS